MKKWEYLTVYYSSKIDSSILDELGNQGWELIVVLLVGHNIKPKWVFKREKIEKANPVDGD